MRVVESQWWIIDLPDEWEADQEEEVIFIRDEDGVGEIAITTMEKTDEDVRDSELRDFTEELEQQFGAGKQLTIGELNGYYFQYREEDEAVREWCMRHGRLLFLVTYSCAEDNAGMDDGAVDEILETLFIKETPEASEQ